MCLAPTSRPTPPHHTVAAPALTKSVLFFSFPFPAFLVPESALPSLAHSCPTPLGRSYVCHTTTPLVRGRARLMLSLDPGRSPARRSRALPATTEGVHTPRPPTSAWAGRRGKQKLRSQAFQRRKEKMIMQPSKPRACLGSLPPQIQPAIEGRLFFHPYGNHPGPV